VVLETTENGALWWWQQEGVCPSSLLLDFTYRYFGDTSCSVRFQSCRNLPNATVFAELKLCYRYSGHQTKLQLLSAVSATSFIQVVEQIL
jgi:hypothetical protein